VRLRLNSRRRLPLTAGLAALVSVAAAITTAQTAQAAAPQILTFANKCVDVRGANTGDGTLIDEWTCNGTVSQQFSIVPLGNGFSLLKTYANKCVDVRGAGTGDGTIIDEWTCNNTVAQEFIV